jgi:hypothetical protein
MSPVTVHLLHIKEYRIAIHLNRDWITLFDLIVGFKAWLDESHLGCCIFQILYYTDIAEILLVKDCYSFIEVIEEFGLEVVDLGNVGPFWQFEHCEVWDDDCVVCFGEGQSTELSQCFSMLDFIKS